MSLFSLVRIRPTGYIFQYLHGQKNRTKLSSSGHTGRFFLLILPIFTGTVRVRYVQHNNPGIHVDMFQSLFFPGGTWSWFALFWFILGAMGMLTFLCLVIAPFFIWKYSKNIAQNTHNTMMYSKHLLEMMETRLIHLESMLASSEPEKEQQNNE